MEWLLRVLPESLLKRFCLTEAWVGVQVPLFIYNHQEVLQEVCASHLKERCQTRSTLIKFRIEHRRQKKWSPLVPWKDCHSFLHPTPVSHGQILHHLPRIWQRWHIVFAFMTRQWLQYSMIYNIVCHQEEQCQAPLWTWRGHRTQTCREGCRCPEKE